MPRYEYHCSTCGKDFEATQRMSDPPLTSCDCGASGTVARRISAGNGLIFKGSGFYITDYKNSGGNGSSDAGKTSESKPAAPAAAPSGGTCGSGGCGACS